MHLNGDLFELNEKVTLRENACGSRNQPTDFMTNCVYTHFRQQACIWASCMRWMSAEWSLVGEKTISWFYSCFKVENFLGEKKTFAIIVTVIKNNSNVWFEDFSFRRGLRGLRSLGVMYSTYLVSSSSPQPWGDKGTVLGETLTHCGRVTQICVFNTVKLDTSASSP